MMLAFLIAAAVLVAACVAWCRWRAAAAARPAREQAAMLAARQAAVIDSAHDAVISADVELRRVQERYRAVVEQTPEAILLAEDGRLVLVNPACVALLGAAGAADLLGRPLTDVLPGWPGALQPVARAASASGSGTAPMFEHRVRRLDGSEREVEIWLADVPDHGGEAVQLVMRDVGDRRRIERIRHDRQRLLLQLDRIARTVPGVIGEWVLRPDGTAAMPYASGVFEAQYGLAPAEVAHDLTPMLQRLHPDDVELFTALVQASARELTPFHHEWRYLHPYRGERWFEGRAMPHRRHDGTVVWHGVVMDVSDRKCAEDSLRDSRASLVEAERIARLGHFNLDLRRRRWTVSESLAELVGRPGRTEWSEAEAMALVRPEDRPRLRRALLPAGPAQGAIDLRFPIVRADDAQARWMHCRGTVQFDRAGQPLRVFGTVQDVTESQQVTADLEHSREELRRLSASLTTAREQERRHISRELHDELGQRLSAIKMEISAVMRSAPPDDDGLRSRLRDLLAGVDVTVSSVRRIAADLRPTMLDDLGLQAALEWLVRDWSERAGLQITLDTDSFDSPLTDAAATTVYRIVQEVLTNISRHAQARSAHLELTRDRQDLRLVIEDDGIGLHPGDTEKGSSFGLMGIRERARMLGGVASIGNRPQGGCRLEVRLPLDRVDSAPGALVEAQ